MQGPHSQELQLGGWGGEHLFLTHTTKWQQMRAGPDLPSSCSPAAHPYPVDRVSSTVLLGGGARSNFPSAAADKREGQLPCLEQVAWEGGGHLSYTLTNKRVVTKARRHGQLSHSYALRASSPTPLTTGPALFCHLGEAQNSPSRELQLVTGRVGSLACCWQQRVRGNGALFSLAHTTT